MGAAAVLETAAETPPTVGLLVVYSIEGSLDVERDHQEAVKSFEDAKKEQVLLRKSTTKGCEEAKVSKDVQFPITTIELP